MANESVVIIIMTSLVHRCFVWISGRCRTQAYRFDLQRFLFWDRQEGHLSSSLNDYCTSRNDHTTTPYNDVIVICHLPWAICHLPFGQPFWNQLYSSNNIHSFSLPTLLHAFSRSAYKCMKCHECLPVLGFLQNLPNNKNLVNISSSSVNLY